jgi:hypothetical protein
MVHPSATSSYTNEQPIPWLTHSLHIRFSRRASEPGENQNGAESHTLTVVDSLGTIVDILGYVVKTEFTCQNRLTFYKGPSTY